MGQPLSDLDPDQIESITSVTLSLIPPVMWSSQLGGILAHIQDAQ